MIPNSLVVPAAVLALALLTWVLVRLVRLTQHREFELAARLAISCGALWAIGLLLATLGGRPRDDLTDILLNAIGCTTAAAIAGGVHHQLQLTSSPV